MSYPDPAHPKPDIRLVVFDLGRVFLRLAPDWRHAFDKAGVPYAAAMDDPGVKAELWELVMLEEVGAFGELGFFDKAGPLLGITPEQFIRVSDAYLCGIFPGSVELIDELNALPVQTACFSNTNHNHWKDLTNPEHPNGLPLHRLTHQFASQLIGHRKPDPGIYQHLEEHTGIQPANILFFDDLQDNIDAASQRGWHTHRVTHPDDTVPELRGVLASYGVLTTTAR